jgi:catechol 2,3-dioxygenase-like lactoylglutathione lyase family enzyme
MGQSTSRRRFVKHVAAAGAAFSAAKVAPGSGQVLAQETSRIKSFDHVAVPAQNVEAMAAFYRAIGMGVNLTANLFSVHFGDQKINFHMPALWQRESFTLKAPAAKPPCGDFCFVWGGTPSELMAMLRRANAKVEEGPVKRQGGRRGGADYGESVYVRDPDGNLLEFIIY